MEELKPMLNQHRLACFNAANILRSGARLYAVTSAGVGTSLDGETFRVAHSHRFGFRLCRPKRCSCGAIIDLFALHPISRRFSAGRHSRHAAINDVIQRALNAAGVQSQLELVGLDIGDGMRRNGTTVSSFVDGRSMIRDATCRDKWSQTDFFSSAVQSGSSSNKAEEGKIARYLALNYRFSFQPIAVLSS